MQLSAGAATGGSILAVLVVGTAHIRVCLEMCRSDAILARSVGPWRCCMCVSDAQNRALHGGMRHVCVGVRLFITITPPTGERGIRPPDLDSVCHRPSL